MWIKRYMDPVDNTPQYWNKIKNILGVGGYLLLTGILLEGLTCLLQPFFSLKIAIPKAWQIGLTVLCGATALSGVIWFNRTLNLFKIHFLGGENLLVTHGPFNYVRHPLYAALLLTIPPIFLLWSQDLVYLLPWVIIYIIAHYVIKIEEKGLVQLFGEEYHRYKQFVPVLIPYKGAGGKRYRKSPDGNP